MYGFVNWNQTCKEARISQPLWFRDWCISKENRINICVIISSSHRIPRMQWWMQLRPLLKILATVDAKLSNHADLEEVDPVDISSDNQADLYNYVVA